MSKDAILDMDFGEMIPMPNVGNTVQQDDIKQGDDVQTVDDTTAPTEDKDDGISLQDALAATVDDTEDIDDTAAKVEDKVEETNNTVDSSSSATNKDGDPSESFALVFAKYLAEEGNLTDFDEEGFTKDIEGKSESEAMEHLFSSEVELNKKEIKTQYDEYSQEYISLKENGVAPEQAGSLVSDKEILDNISEDQITESEDLRRDILTRNFQVSTKFTDDKIKKLVNQIIDIGDDVEDTKEALGSLKKANADEIEAARTSEISRKKEAEDNYKAYITSLSDTINSTKEIIPGQTINKTTKDKLHEMITKPVKQNAQGQRLNSIWAKRDEDEIKFDTTLAYLMMNGVFDGKWDKIVTKQKTKAVQDLKAKIDSSNKASFSGGKTHVSKQDKTSTQDKIAEMKRTFNF